jgi:hypothetical protein
VAPHGAERNGTHTTPHVDFSVPPFNASPTTAPSAPAVGQQVINPAPQIFDSQYQPTAIGNYPEQVSGSYDLNGHTVNVASSGTLLVQTAGGSGLQTWSETSAKNQPADNLGVSFQSTGIALQTESLGLEASTSTCTFAPPVPILPVHPVFGSTTKSHASCGNLSADVTTVDVGTKTIVIGGTNYATLEVRSTIITVGTTPATVTETSWVSPTLRLPLRAVQQTVTTYQGLPYRITTTTDVTALPAA